MQRTANSAAKIAIGYANFNAIFTAPFAAFDAGVMVPMKSNSLLIIFVFSISGCSTIGSKFEVEKPQWGHPYSGVVHSKGMVCASLITAPLTLGIGLIGLVDVPLSIAADTLLLPYDLAVTPEYERVIPKWPVECSSWNTEEPENSNSNV